MCTLAPVPTGTKADALATLRGVGLVRRAASAKGRALTEEALTADWRGVTVVKREGEQPIRAAVAREFRREERQVLDNLETVSRSLVFDLDAWARSMAAEIGPGALAAIRAGFEAGAARIGIRDVDVTPFRPDDPRVRVPLRQILGKTRDISATTADALTRSLSQGTAAGETLEELAARVRNVFSQATGYRSRAIAQTSATGATEAGQLYVMEEAGIERRGWLSARLATSRTDHVVADGQEVGISEPFVVGGESLMYPSDPAGSASNTIHCYCTVLPLL